MDKLTPLLPAALSFGPIFMVLGLQEHGSLVFAYVGALLMGFGLLVLFGNQQVLKKRLADIEGK